jgi:hypothetical protein
MNTMKDSRPIGMSMVILVAAMGVASAQTKVDLATQSKNVDFSKATSTKPAQVGPNLPPACSAGQIFFDSTAPAGQNLYGCTGTNAWSLQGGTGGGGTGMASQFGDFNISNTSATVQTLGAVCSTVTPCQIRTGTVLFTMTGPVTLTLGGTSTSGTIYWYLSSLQVLTAGHNSAATLTCSAGCNVATGVTFFPPDSIPLWKTTFAGNVLDPISFVAMDKRAIYSRDVIAVGPGVSSVSDPSTGIQTFSTDPTQVPRYFTGTGAPSGTCTTGRDFYTDTTGLSQYFCKATNSWATLAPAFPAAAVTLTAGTGVTSVTCTSPTCDLNGGSLTIVGGTATTGTVATIGYTGLGLLVVPRSCLVAMNGGATYLGIGHGAPSTASFTVTSAVTVSGVTFNVDYSCRP